MRKGLGFHNRHSAGGGFSPLSLFSGGVNGAWYDPSDSTTLFSDRAGTTPCGTPGGGSVVPVGLMLDKSQGLVLGPELVTNGDFSNGTTGWTAAANNTLTNDAGRGKCVSSVANGAGFGQTFSAVANTTYKFVWSGISDGTSVAPAALLGTVLGASNRMTAAQTGGYAFGTNRIFYYTATATETLWLWFYGNIGQPIGNYILIDNVSVQSIAGNHAIAANDTTARPELSALVNLLNGSATLATQSVTTVATTYTLYFTGSGSITLSGTATGTYTAGSSSVVCTAGTLTLTVSGAVTTADLRPANLGAQLPVYQARTNANTYDAVGFPRYLAFNGTSSAMSTPANVNLSGTDKVTVFAGVRKLSDAGTQAIAELSANFGTNAGTFAVFAADPSGANYYAGLQGTTIGRYRPATYTAPISNVLAVGYDIGAAALADEIKPRVNGVLNQADPSGGAGTGNFGSYPLFIGSRNNASIFLNGNIYSLIVVGSAVSAGQISATEQWVAQRTGIVL